MNIKLKRSLMAGMLALGIIGGATACDSDAKTVNDNITTDADNFKIPRKIVFYNSISDTVMWTIEGYCQVEVADAANFRATCKVQGGYTRDMLGRSDNVTYMVIQEDPAKVSPDHRTIVFKPSTLIPNFELR